MASAGSTPGSRRLWPATRTARSRIRALALAAVALLSAACAAAQGTAQAAGSMLGLTAEERGWLAAHPVLRIGVNRAAPPFTYVENGRHLGIDAKIIARLGSSLGVRIEPVLDAPWDRIQAMASEGSVDLLGLVPETPERRHHLLFTVPVTDVEYSLFVRADRAGADTLSDLNGQRVAVVATFAVRQWMERDYPGAKIVPVDTAIQGLQALSTGQVDAAVSTLGGASWLIRQKGIVNLRVQQTLYRPLLAIGVRKDWPQLVTILNKAIAQLPPSEIDQIKRDFIALKVEGYTRSQIALAVGATVMTSLLVLLSIGLVALRRQRNLAIAKQLSDSRYRQLFEHSLDGVLQTRPDGSVLAANAAACRIFGMTEAELCARGRAGLADASDPRLAALLASRAEHGAAQGELRMRRADGSLFEAEVTSVTFTGPAGETLSSIMLRDVTLRRLSEAQLRLLEAAVAELNDILVITEADPLEAPGPRIVYVNAAFTRITGYSREEVIGRSPRMLRGPATADAESARIGDALQRGQPVRAELVNYTKAGQPYWVELQISPIYAESRQISHFVSVQRVIDERKQAEETRIALEGQLRESQKMEAIGTLAGGIAHDFNNIIGGIIGSAELARQDLEPDHRVQAALAQIQQASRRARRLVEQILTFSRRQPQTLTAQAMGPLIEETVTLLRRTLPAGISLEVELPPQPLAVLADPVQFQQILVNLCTNAWQAMNGSGRIRVMLDEVSVDAAAQTHSGLPPGRYAHLRVEDDGSGMDEATRSRIFEPFFTTKRPGEGTGLGLAVVRGIVLGHRGLIEVQSSPGAGTTFHLWFPAIDAAAATPADTEAPGAAAGRGEQVLYVDDDEVLRLMVERLLQRSGYRVTCLADPTLVAGYLDSHPDQVDVVVTDYNMPQMSGLDLARQLRLRAPDLPVVLSTGFLSAELEAQARRLGVRSFVRKELTLEQIAPAIADALHPHNGPASAAARVAPR